MVKIVDGYKEEKEANEEYDRMYATAERFFPGRVRKKDLGRIIRDIEVETTDKTAVSLKICPSFRSIYLHQESDLCAASDFATQEEKEVGREFTLKTTYPILVEQPK
jgi:hypothetical protein